MENTKKVINNFALKFIAEIYGRLGTLFLVILIARVYGVEYFAKYAVAFTLANMFQIFTDFGLHTILIRDISADQRTGSDYMSRFVALKSITSLVAITALFITGLIIKYDDYTFSLILIAGFWMAANSIIDAINSYFTAYEDFGTILKNTIIYKSMLYALAFPLIYYGITLFNLCLIIVFSSITGVLTGFILIFRKYGSLKIIFDIDFIKLRIKDAFPIAIGGVFASIYTKIDTLMLSKIKGDIQTGLYNSVFRIYDTLIIIPAIFQTIILPRFVRYLHSDTARLKMAFTRSVLFILIISLPITSVFYMKSEWIVLLLYGNEYIDAGNALRIISPAVTLIFISCMPAILLIAENKQKINAYINFAGLIFCVAGNLYAIHRWGFLGSSAVLVLNQLIMAILFFYSTFRWLEYSYLLKNIAKIIASSAVLFFALHKIDILNNFVSIALSLSLFAVMLILTRAVKIDEIKYLFSFGEGREIS